MSDTLDIARSLLRSAAGEASAGLSRLSRSSRMAPIKRALDAVLRGRLFITDLQLTASVARVPSVLAATVSTHEEGLRINASFRDGSELLLRLCPQGVTFAQHGAKELRVRVEPAEAALHPHAGDLLIALGAEVARTLWGGLLSRQSGQDKSAFVQREVDVFILDLRTLSEVRTALNHRMRATGIEAVSLLDIKPETGGLRLLPRIAGL